jgi:hypothetical protein
LGTTKEFNMAKDMRGDEYIDSRDVIERISELEDELRDVHSNELEELADRESPPDDPTEDPPRDFDAWIEWVLCDSGHLYYEEADEFNELKQLQDEARGYSDWEHGAQLIREDKFEDYARELAEDIGSMSRDVTWPHNHIDWAAAANELKTDYTEVSFDGTAYLLRD